MKSRNGFVSNSSSSSFMCCIAKITDSVKAKAWLDGLSLGKYEYDVSKVKDIPSEQYNMFSMRRMGRIIVESFQSEVFISDAELDDNDEILAINIANDEGDSLFSIVDGNGDWEDYNYDIDLDFFPKNQRSAFKGLTEENGFTMVQKTFGAGRNG